MPAEWRVGRKLGRTLYDGEVFVGLMETRELAAEVVEAMNGRERYIEGGPEVDEQLAKLGALASAPRLYPPSGRERSLDQPVWACCKSQSLAHPLTHCPEAR